MLDVSKKPVKPAGLAICDHEYLGEKKGQGEEA